MHRFIFPLLSLFCFAQTAHAAVEENWREDAKLFIEQHKHDSALYLAQQAADSATREPDRSARVNLLRFAGEVEWLAGKHRTSQHHFTEALDIALKSDEIWRALSLGISVLELHQKTANNIGFRRDLLQRSIDNNLLSNAASDRHATEIGRYVRTFKGAIDPYLTAQLLKQIYLIPHGHVRKKALFALSKLSLEPVTAKHITFSDTPRHDADDFERLLWHVNAAKLYRIAHSNHQFYSHKEKAERIVGQLPQEKKSKAKKLMKLLD